MKTTPFPRPALLLALATSLLALSDQPASAQTLNDDIAVIRSLVKGDRTVVVAEAMQLTGPESDAFWPLYRNYRGAMDTLGDGLVKLVLEYADVYPSVPEDRAQRMLKDYLALETKRNETRAKHLKKLAKALPPSKVLRFAQVENRLDLALRLQMASAIPLVPVPRVQP